MRGIRIHEVHIERFRAIRGPLDLDFRMPSGEPSPVVVLAGPNGSGKTSILEAILYAMGRGDLVARSRGADEATEFRPPPGAITRVSASFEGHPEPAEWVPEHIATFDPERRVEYFSSWRTPALVGAVKPLAGPGRRPSDTEPNRLWRLKQRITDEVARVAFENGTRRSSKAEDWLARINRAWQLLHHDETRIDAQIAEPDAEDVRADLYLMRGDERVCTVDELSSGELELLTLAGAVVLNELRDSLVLFDEPELHLHPEWQAGLIPALRSLAPNAQFILATHSDTVWDRAPGAVRFSLMPHRTE